MKLEVLVLTNDFSTPASSVDVLSYATHRPFYISPKNHQEVHQSFFSSFTRSASSLPT